MTVSKGRMALVTSFVVLLVHGDALAADPAAVCTATKVERAGQLHLCLLEDLARIIRGKESRVLKCTAKFAAGWRKAEEKAAGGCRTIGDETAVQAQVTADVVAIFAALNPSLPTTTTTLPPSGGPCGDGTWPSCGGACAAGSSCWATVTAGPTMSCTCFPEVATPCSETGGFAAGGATCGGACPAGEVCTTIAITEALQASCGCIPVGSTPCLDRSSGTCDGSCPGGLTCTATALLPCECR